MQEFFMYIHEPVPFHVMYSNANCMKREQMIEQEYGKMMSLAPNRIQMIQKQIEAELDQVEFEGSPLYDEYPDKIWISKMYTRIREKWKIKEQDCSFEELIYMMILYEITRRRVKFCNTKKSILRF